MLAGTLASVYAARVLWSHPGCVPARPTSGSLALLTTTLTLQAGMNVGASCAAPGGWVSCKVFVTLS